MLTVYFQNVYSSSCVSYFRLPGEERCISVHVSPTITGKCYSIINFQSQFLFSHLKNITKVHANWLSPCQNNKNMWFSSILNVVYNVHLLFILHVDWKWMSPSTSFFPPSLMPNLIIMMPWIEGPDFILSIKSKFTFVWGQYMFNCRKGSLSKLWLWTWRPLHCTPRNCCHLCLPSQLFWGQMSGR